MTRKESIQMALTQYEAGRLRAAKHLLLPMTRRIPVTDDNVGELIEDSISSATIAAEGWIDLAIDRIDRDLGEDNHALVPVGLALRTAISLLK